MTSNLRDESQVRHFFRPEFINRLDDILVFESLSEDELRKIVDVQLARLAKHLAEQEIALLVTDAAKDELAKEGYSPEFGARPLKRAIQKHVQNLLAEEILTGKLARGDRAVVDVVDGRFAVRVERAAPEPREEPAERAAVGRS
jgi:ATP-dependent Clp protease ATP-binding subunit ClpC